MPRGPAPHKNKRRSNTDAIPKTQLPASGRKGRPPKVPEAYNLQKAGKAWWRWAWATPQATGWDPGALYVLARRAQLEDDLGALGSLNDEVELSDLLAGADEEAIERVKWALATLKASAGGRLAVEKEMRELDKVLGLTPKGLIDLRWEIVSDEDAKPKAASEAAPKVDKKTADRKARLKLVS